MASLWQRFMFIFRSKANAQLDKREDPRQTLDYSYTKQLELLQQVRRGVADVATSRKRLELQMKQLSDAADKLHRQAEQAMTSGREDLAREALTRRSGLQAQLTDLQAQHASLQGEEEKLTAASQRLSTQVESFRTRKETIKATYTAAEAQSKIGEAFSGISTEFGDVTAAMQRAEDKTAQLQARSGALDELIASGSLDDISAGGRKDDIQAELDRMSSTSDVELELAKLKGQVTGGTAPGAIAAGGASTGTTEIPAAQPAIDNDKA